MMKRLSLFVFLISLLACTATLGQLPDDESSAEHAIAKASAVTAMRTADFIGKLGVNTHIPYTDGLYANIPQVIADLKYLGVYQLRDVLTNGYAGGGVIGSYISIAQAGGKWNFGNAITNGVAWTSLSLATQFALFDQLWVAAPGSIVAIEGANEINNFFGTYNGVGSTAGAVLMQQDTYSYTRADRYFSKVPVYYFTGYGVFTNGAYVTPVGPDPSATPGLANYDNAHPYPCYYCPPASYIYPYPPNYGLLNNETAGKLGPFVYTEIGYNSNQTNTDVQAKYTLSLLMDAAKYGAYKVFLYQLLDAYAPGSPQGDDGWGLFDYSNTPKPIATGIRNLTTILADPGGAATTFTPMPLVYGPPNLVNAPAPLVGPSGGPGPTPINSLLMQKSNGIYELVIWLEPLLWNPSTGTEITAPAVKVQVQLGKTFRTAKIYDPLVSSSPVSTLRNVKTVTLSVVDHPVILELVPELAANRYIQAFAR